MRGLVLFRLRESSKRLLLLLEYPDLLEGLVEPLLNPLGGAEVAITFRELDQSWEEVRLTRLSFGITLPGRFQKILPVQ